MPSTSLTAARESSRISLVCFWTRFHSGIWEGNFANAALCPERVSTNPPFNIIVVSVHIWAANLLISHHQRPFLPSILPFCTNKKLLVQFYLTPTFPESRVNWKLGQTEEENRTGTNWHPRHGSAFSTRRAMTHRRRRRTSTPVSCLKPVLLLCPFQHFPVPFCWF